MLFRMFVSIVLTLGFSVLSFAECLDFSTFGQSIDLGSRDGIVTNAGKVWDEGRRNSLAFVGGCLQKKLIDIVQDDFVDAIYIVRTRRDGKRYLLYKFKDQSEAWFEIQGELDELFAKLNGISVEHSSDEIGRSSTMLRGSKIRKITDRERLRKLLDGYSYYSKGFFPHATGSESIVTSTLHKISFDDYGGEENRKMGESTSEQ